VSESITHPNQSAEASPPAESFSSELKPETHARARRWSLVSGICVAAVGTVSTALLAVFIWHLQAKNQSPAALAMADMHMTDMGRFWAFPVLQASGLTGLLFAYISVLLGLQQSARALPGLPLSYRQIDRLHRQISLLVIGLVIVHVAATAMDAMGDNVKTVLIPWAEYQSWPDAAWGYTLGIVALYALLIVAPTFYVRRLIRTARWRFLHRFVLVFYGLSVWHALILGLDMSYYGWIRPVTWLVQIPLLALFIRRLLFPIRASSKLAESRLIAIKGVRYGLVALSTAGIAASIAIVASGHSDLIKTI
jgi:DMSO/TMAO reductase YedYZ heme-binding membrane subunit